MSRLLGQKDCDLPKSYTYSQLPNNGSSEPGGRLNVSGGVCDTHALHQDQVNLDYVCVDFVILLPLFLAIH